MQKIYRPDREGPRRSEFEKNKKKILMSQSICGICGKPVDKSLKFPNPMSAAIDHIIPVDKGGDPSNIGNLQLTHLYCNRQKSDKIMADTTTTSATKVFNNRDLPLSIDWTKYRSDVETGE
ncbi:MAG: HNH endonuclease [Lachnospiraceae bacterium]|nr:HNH endonuclease [Lachnospiraceae bacterium]